MNKRKLIEDSKDIGNAIGIVYQTNDYDAFKFMEDNREVLQSRVERLKQSFSEMYIPCPIIINQNYEIIDGQGRFNSAKELNMSILYLIVEDANIDDCRRMNVCQKNWTTWDFIESYAVTGNINYKIILEFRNKFPYISGAQNIVYYLHRSQDNFDGKILEIIKSGNLKIKPGFEESYEIAVNLKDFEEFNKELITNYRFQLAFLTISKCGKYCHERMIRKLRQLPKSLVVQPRVKEYLQDITYVYNYKCGKTEEYIDFSYEERKRNGYR